MNTSNNQQGFAISETLYVQPGSRRCRIFALNGKPRLGQSPEEMLSTGARQVGHLEDGRIVALEKKYWATADETRLTGGMLLPVKEPGKIRTDA